MSFAPFSASVMSTIVNLYIGLPVVVTTGRLGSDSTGALSICTVQQECIYAYYVLFTRDPILQKSTGQFAPECRRNTLSPEFSRSCWLPGGSFTPTPVRDSFYLSLACWLASCLLLVFLTAPPGSSSCPFSSRRLPLHLPSLCLRDCQPSHLRRGRPNQQTSTSDSVWSAHRRRWSQALGSQLDRLSAPSILPRGLPGWLPLS